MKAYFNAYGQPAPIQTLRCCHLDTSM